MMTVREQQQALSQIPSLCLWSEIAHEACDSIGSYTYVLKTIVSPRRYPYELRIDIGYQCFLTRLTTPDFAGQSLARTVEEVEAAISGFNQYIKMKILHDA